MEVVLVIVVTVTAVMVLFIANKQRNRNVPASTNDALSFIDYVLNVSGYKLTPYGAGVSLLSLNNGFSKEETFSHMA